MLIRLGLYHHWRKLLPDFFSSRQRSARIKAPFLRPLAATPSNRNESRIASSAFRVEDCVFLFLTLCVAVSAFFLWVLVELSSTSHRESPRRAALRGQTRLTHTPLLESPGVAWIGEGSEGKECGS
jgi:hypothetical protein